MAKPATDGLLLGEKDTKTIWRFCKTSTQNSHVVTRPSSLLFPLLCAPLAAFPSHYSTDLLGKGPRLPLSLPGLVQEEVFHWQRASFDTWIPDSMGMQRPDAFLEVKLSLRTAPTQCLFLRKGGLLFQSGTVKRDGKKWDKLSGWFIQIHCTHGIVTSTDLNSHAGKEDIVIFPRKKSYCGTKPKIFQWVWN